MAAWGWAGGRGMTPNGKKLSLWDDENVLKVHSDDGCTIL